MTGFILGSLLTIWPWKNELTDPNFVNRKGELKVIGYEWFMPQSFDTPTIISILMIVLGIVSVYFVEKMGEQQTK